MKFKLCSLVGPKGDNQDAVLPPFEIGGCTWCAIADGVGSSSLGGLASHKSLEIVQKVLGSETMSEVFANVQLGLSEVVHGQETNKSISSTLSVLKICGTRAFVGHVGDTRITHYRDAGVVGRTKDQTEVQKLLEDGVLTKNQAARYPRKNVLLSAMSATKEFDLYQKEFSVQKADRILLTSDGFHTKLLRGQIAQLSSSNLEFEDFWLAIQAVLLSIELSDDASCIAIEID